MNKAVRERLIVSLLRVSAWASVGILVAVLFLLVSYGGAVIDARFLTAAWHHRDIARGGIRDAILGSLSIGVGVTLVSFPLGIATAIYLTEYSGSARWRRAVQLAIRNLAGVPSVVYGLFGLAMFVQMLGLGASMLAAILTLSAMTLPWIISASVESLSSVPDQFRASSLALGATHFQTIRRIVLPAALPGCITGGILGIARSMGETAPIIMVGATFYLSRPSYSLFDAFMALPYHAFILATQHSSPDARAYAAGTSLVLIALIFALSLGAILLRYRYRSKKDW